MGTLEKGKQLGSGDAAPNRRATLGTFRYHSYMKDSIAVQKRHNYVNDDEVHEENPHLEDFLVPHHSGDVQPPLKGSVRPALGRPSVSILHDRDCPSRHSCEITESKRHISFHQVTVRDYDMVLGDHPSCSYGPPVTLGWHYIEYEPLDLNEYEYHHARRRPLRALMLNYYRRMNILGVENSVAELKKATKEVNRTKLQRAITRKFSPCWRVFDASESASRKLKKCVKKGEPAKQWNPEDELDWSVHGTGKSILKN
mmetsp:Transcript_31396/g.66872  ORF Transcript_31396/g.66872 Transcript_31396/m.66872 type:complete len:256 (-) Transcript_31396:229-996(-)|eukprot:CAMPEP_0172553746 /NCGR_PEP_ID=MMETSP1067-20121228/51524_1 /TAXON_ID=265564 ORGANISM="Thalassiosira punctigera, Strain Tpunct2005C2" /NCGR_SAMPLE_ID=MMETSP1067 /ASSEMBLY_ACC=CAM_ASM_000444 /LENGTH=255 /DNA_ID=CAMNT_0013341969 /DNA_START=174 /DNA_END=941 /DNA_ORIENTATION=+